MKTRFSGLLLAVVFTVSLCVGQSEPQDVLYLKNGSVIRGTVLEFIPDKSIKIQTADGNLFVYTMAEVEKLVREQPVGQKDDPWAPEQNSREAGSGAGYNGSGFSLFAGVALPVGDFGSTGSSGGGAKTGFAVGADGSLAFAPALAWMTSADVLVNSLDGASLGSGYGLSVDAGSWTSVWALTGFKVFGAVSPEVQLFGFAQAGLLFGWSPDLTVSYGSAVVTQNSASATAFGFGFGAGMQVNHFALGVRYLSGQPEYEVTASGMGQSVKGKVKQVTSCIAISAGVVF